MCTYFYTMPHNSPILIIEDDLDDCELVQSALGDIGISNKLKCFPDGSKALSYLNSTSERTFLILSDINMPQSNGFDLKENINLTPRLRKQAIPFIYLTTSSSQKDIDKAYELFANGFFTKPDSYRALTELLKSIIVYWKQSEVPQV